MTPEFVNLHCAFEVWKGEEMTRRRDRLIEVAKARDPRWRLETRCHEPIAEINQEIKGDKWPYKVVFQKALFRSYLELLEQAQEFVGEHPILELRKRFTDYWIEATNALFDSDLGLTNAKVAGALFWKGSGLQPDGTIEFTKAGSDRLQGWLKVWLTLYKLGTDAPTHSKLQDDDSSLSGIIENAFRETRPMTHC